MENRSFPLRGLMKTSSSRSSVSKVRARGGEEAEILHCGADGAGRTASDSEYGRSGKKNIN